MDDELIGQRFVIRSTSPSILSLSGDPEGYFTEIFVSQAANGNSPQLTATGIAAATSTVILDVALDGAQLLHESTDVDQTTHGWQHTGSIPVDHGLLTVQLFDQNEVPLDSYSVHLRSDLEAIPKGEVSQVKADDTRLLAGFGDRIIRTRSFALIEKPPLFIIEPIVDDFVLKGKALNSITIREEGKGHELSATFEEYKNGASNFDKSLDVLIDRGKKDDRQIRRAINSSFKNLLDSTYKPRQIDKNAKRSQPGVDYDEKNKNLIVTLPASKKSSKSSGDYPSVDLKDYYGQSRVGMCFSERIRYRSAGLVRGEPLYSLALDAGEEVELRQSSETIRSLTSEDILDRENENTTTLSSKWSTDVSSAFNTAQSETTDWNLGSELGFAGVPKLPLNLGVSGGYSAESAAENTIELTTQSAYELSTVAVAKLRAQHRTRMEVQDRSTLGSASVRTLHNRGAVRPRRVDFYKMYRKEKATYERFDAHMCLRLCVNDPGRKVREQFETSLDSIDPENDEHYTSVPLPDESKKSIVRVTFTPSIPLERGPGKPVTDGYSKEYISVNLKADGDDPIPSSYLLVGSTKVRMVSMKRNFKAINFLPNPGEEKEYNESNDSHVTTSTGIEVLLAFDQDEHQSDPSATENRVKWQSKPQSSSTNGAGLLEINYYNWINLIGTSHNYITEIVLEIESNWATPSEDITAIEENRATIKDEISSNLSVESLLNYRDVAKQDYLGELLAQAMTQHLNIHSYVSPISPKDIPEIFDLANAYAENAPYWATADATARYAQLRDRLSQLNLPIPISTVLIPELVASQAVLYLPIRHGAEKEVLTLLDDYSDGKVDSIVSGFTTYHEKEFGKTQSASTLPSYEDVSAPSRPDVTELGSDQWSAPWEQSQRKFSVLAHWADFVPTDGVDCETKLSATSRADEALLIRLNQEPDSLP